LNRRKFRNDLDEATKNVINTAVASPAMQQYQFTIAPGCRYSVINAMYFCNSVEARAATQKMARMTAVSAHARLDAMHVAPGGTGGSAKKVVPAVAIG